MLELGARKFTPSCFILKSPNEACLPHLKIEQMEFLRGPVVRGLPSWFSGKDPPASVGGAGDVGREGPLQWEMTTHSSILA